MITTLSFCPVCYRKVEAAIINRNGVAVMVKVCPVHEVFESVVEPDFKFMSERYNYSTKNNNNNIIIHVENSCNMRCSWCYYDFKDDDKKEATYYANILRMYQDKNFGWLLSGGEPTERSDYFKFVDDAKRLGWGCTTITNMLNFSDLEYVRNYLQHDYNPYGYLDLVLSMHTPKHYTDDIYKRKIEAIENISKTGRKVQCIAFSIDSLDEVKWVREFYDKYKSATVMFRIRTLFPNWNNKETKRLYLSQLYDEFMSCFGDQTPIKHENFETSNFYCMYMVLHGGTLFSLSSGPSVDNIDYHICSRPVYMLANDQRCYPVPTAQIINEGLSKGWYAGHKMEVK